MHAIAEPNPLDFLLLKEYHVWDQIPSPCWDDSVIQYDRPILSFTPCPDNGIIGMIQSFWLSSLKASKRSGL